MLNEAQAGCWQGHVFKLLALVQNQLLTHGKLYVCFIDFKKAFKVLLFFIILLLILRKHLT